MLANQGEQLRFTFTFVDSTTKLGKTGLTPTVNIYRNGSGTAIATGTATEWVGGTYYYTLSGASVDADGDYIGVATTTSSDVMVKVSYSCHIVGKAGTPNLDATISSRAAAATALSTAQWTNTRAGYLDNLDAAVSSRAAAATALSTAQWTNTRAGYLDNLDAAISTRAAAATALSTVQWTNTRAGYLDNLDATVSSRAAAATALSTAQWTNTRAGYLDNLDATISSRLATASYSSPPSAATISAAVWSEGTRTLTGFGFTVTATLGSGTLGDIADKILGRSISTGSDGGRTVQDALQFLRNKWTIIDDVLTVYAEDDVTTAWTATTTDGGGNTVSGVDPA